MTGTQVLRELNMLPADERHRKRFAANNKTDSIQQ